MLVPTRLSMEYVISVVIFLYSVHSVQEHTIMVWNILVCNSVDYDNKHNFQTENKVNKAVKLSYAFYVTMCS